MKVLITGGSGFLGSHITDSLLTRGDNVVVIDNYETGRDNLTTHPNLKVVEGIIADADLLDSLFDGVDLVIHAAASYKNLKIGPKMQNQIFVEPLMLLNPV